MKSFKFWGLILVGFLLAILSTGIGLATFAESVYTAINGKYLSAILTFIGGSALGAAAMLGTNYLIDLSLGFKQQLFKLGNLEKYSMSALLGFYSFTLDAIAFIAMIFAAIYLGAVIVHTYPIAVSAMMFFIILLSTWVVHRLAGFLSTLALTFEPKE